MLVWKSSVTAKAIPAAAIIIVVGGDAVVGHALELLLRGSGYNARFEALPTFAADGTPLDAGLILLAPGLDERGREAVLTSVDVARRGGDLSVIELVPAMSSWPGEGHALLPWPCRTEDLEREVETALHGTGGPRRVGVTRPGEKENRP